MRSTTQLVLGLLSCGNLIIDYHHVNNSLLVFGFTTRPNLHIKRQITKDRIIWKQRQGINTARFALESLEATSSSTSSFDSNNSTAVLKTKDDTSNTDASLTSSSTDSTDTTISKQESASMASGAKLRRLKDLMWVRETLEDLTAAEFACTVEAHNDDRKVTTTATSSTVASTKSTGSSSNSSSSVSRRSKRKRAVDYEKLLTQLNKRLRDLGCESYVNDNDDGVQCILQNGVGYGSLTYTDEQRKALLERLLRTRTQLLEVIHGNEIDISESESSSSFLKLPKLPRMELPKEEVDDDVQGPKLYVRDDGTVDWDGALQDQAALRKFGTAVWARINGREVESVDGEDKNATESSSSLDATDVPKVTAKIVETPAIKEARAKLDKFRKDLTDMEREHTKLLNSAISQGQAVANVKLASLEPKLRSQIKLSAASLDDMKLKVSFQTLVYELERIYTYLLGEIGNPALSGYIPLQDRLNVAEFGLLESQIDSFNRQFMDNETVDEDVLAVVFEQLADFKRRLGIDYYVTGLSFDREVIGLWLNDLLIKTKKGLAFYVKGVRLFWNDIIFCLRLFNRAAQGYTLKPREVRTLRRTFKDIITFIPFVIILLIPLSPIGHVLVFGAIQRFFPDFFPSCFTEQRQNLLQLYETAEYTELTINETWSEKISRLSEAIAYMFASFFRKLYYKLLNAIRGNMRKDEKDSEINNDSSSKQVQDTKQ